MTSVEELKRRQDEAERRQDALYATIRPKLDALEPVVRREARQGLIDSLSAEGKVVKDRKPKRQSGTMWGGGGTLVSSLAVISNELSNALTTGNWADVDWTNFWAAVVGVISSGIVVWRRIAVGDLQ